jgi:hypothetical protein
MELPFDYTGHENRVIVRLIRNLYGSKQAAYMWYTLLCEVLLEYGFVRSIYEPCCFIYHKNDIHIIVCVYVDDLLITGNREIEVENVKVYLSKVFHKIKDLKGVDNYLGLRMTKTENIQLILHQSEYIESILNEYKNKDIKIRIRNTPLPHDLPPQKYSSSFSLNGDQPSILGFLGKLRYLADRTRPDISFAASFLVILQLDMSMQFIKL